MSTEETQMNEEPVQVVRLTAAGLRRLAEQMESIAEQGVERAEIYVDPDDEDQQPYFDGGKTAAVWTGAFSIGDDTDSRDPDVLVAAVVCHLSTIETEDTEGLVET